jgi:hypothetical protein
MEEYIGSRQSSSPSTVTCGPWTRTFFDEVQKRVDERGHEARSAARARPGAWRAAITV